MPIRHTIQKKNLNKKSHATWLSIVFLFDLKFFLTEDTEE